jgi:hypothetical protein
MRSFPPSPLELLDLSTHPIVTSIHLQYQTTVHRAITSKEGARTRIDYSMLCSSQDHLGTTTRDLDHPILASAENTDSWRARKGDLQHVFPLDVLMVPLSMLVVATGGERLLCGGFTLGETICFGCLEFITNRFGGLSLSP